MIVIITSGQPSLNPRLVKEADALISAGYEVSIIYQYWNDWGTNLDKELLIDKKWHVYQVGGSPFTEKILYLKSRLRFKLAKVLSKIFGFKKNLAEHAIGRCTPLLIKKAKTIQADLYIAHNLAALPAAVQAAKKNRAKCGFDAEDFHRNEVTDNPSAYDYLLKSYIENKYFKQLDYLSTASPLISTAYSKLFTKPVPITFLNAFPKQTLIKKQNKDGSKLKLFWFSQTIGGNRGLENVIKALGLIPNIPIELHLLGNYDYHIKDHFRSLTVKNGLAGNLIHYYSPIPAYEIYSFAAQFDVGLATEMPSPKNRDICLTNKIFTYVQSELAILVSNTSAQKKLLEDYPGMGIIYDQSNIKDLAYHLKGLAENPDDLKKLQSTASKYGKEFLNWETESVKFLALISNLLH